MRVKKKPDFDPNAFLATIGEGRKFVLFPKKQTIFTQGDAPDAVFHIQKGKVKLTVVSNDGKEATIRHIESGRLAIAACRDASWTARRSASASCLRRARRESILMQSAVCPYAVLSACIEE